MHSEGWRMRDPREVSRRGLKSRTCFLRSRHIKELSLRVFNRLQFTIQAWDRAPLLALAAFGV